MKMIPDGLKPIPSLPGAHISIFGDLWIEPWLGSDGRRLPGGWRRARVRGDGYSIVMVYGRLHLLHRLIAEAHIPNPRLLPVVRHRDDTPSNNFVDNLEWGTHADNTQDMISRGRAGFQRLETCVNGHDIEDRDAGGNCNGCTHDRRSSGLPQGDSRHGTPNGFNNYGCRCEPCTLSERERGRMKYARSKNVRVRET